MKTVRNKVRHSRRWDAAITNLKRTVNRQRAAVRNLLLERSALSGRSMDPEGRNLDAECGYPTEPAVQDYKDYYDREGIATRVVNVFPEESWSIYPELYETEDRRRTAFERRWDALTDELDPWHYLHRVDELSGIGHYGILVLGLDDGGDFDTPVPGIGPDGLPDKKSGKVDFSSRKLLYLQTFSEDLVQINEFEEDPRNPRFGQPVSYTVTVSDPQRAKQDDESDSEAGTKRKVRTFDVHWTRVIHVADNRKTSEVFGVPRMQSVFNRLYDLRKILGGSGEMFWRGAFPGYSFESFPEVTDDSLLDEDSIREQFDDYASGLRRYLALTGMTAKSLAPQVADPTQHVTQQIMAICASKGVPYSTFMGAEAGHLAGIKDASAWNRRLGFRQRMYVTPKIIRPFARRLVLAGVLPEPEKIYVSWKDLNALSDLEKADVALKRSQAAMQYVSGGVETLIPPEQYLSLVLGLSEAEVTAVMDAVKAKGVAPKMATKAVWGQPPAAPAAGKKAKTQGGGRRGNAGKGSAGRPMGVVSRA